MVRVLVNRFCMHYSIIRSQVNGYYRTNTGETISNSHFIQSILAITTISSVQFLCVCSIQLPGNEYVIFFIDWCIQLTGSAHYLFMIFVTLMFFLGTCSYVEAMVECLREILLNLDRSICQLSTSNKQTAHRRFVQATAKAIQFHQSIFE